MSEMREREHFDISYRLDLLRAGKLGFEEALELHEQLERMPIEQDSARGRKLPEQMLESMLRESEYSPAPIGFFDELCLREIEQEATPEELATINRLVLTYPSYADRRGTLQSTVLQPDECVLFTGKEQLKRGTTPWAAVVVRTATVAASLLLLFALGIDFWRKPATPPIGERQMATITPDAIGGGPVESVKEQGVDTTSRMIAEAIPPLDNTPLAAESTPPSRAELHPLAPLGVPKSQAISSVHLAMRYVPELEFIDWEFLTLSEDLEEVERIEQELAVAEADAEEEILEESRESESRGARFLRLLAIANGF